MPSRPTQFNFLKTIALLTVAFFGLSYAQSFLVPLCFSALLTFLLTPGVRILRSRGVPEGLALAITSCLFLIPFAAIGYETIAQSEGMIHRVPALLKLIQGDLTLISNSTWGTRLGLADRFDSLTMNLSPSSGTNAGSDIAFKGASAFLSAGEDLLVVLTFALLMLASRERLKRFLEGILKRNSISAISSDPTHFIESIAELIQRFLVVRLFIVALVAVMDWVVLRAYGLPYALLLALSLGLMTLIPVFGFIVGVIPPLLLAVAEGFSLVKVGSMLVALGLVSSLEGQFIGPRLMGRHLNLSLLATFLGLFVGERIWGMSGLFLSIPILGVFRIVLTSTPAGIPWSQLIAEKEDGVSLSVLREKIAAAAAVERVSKRESCVLPATVE